MNVSALNVTTTTIARPTVTKPNPQTSRTTQFEPQRTVLPSGDTVQISAQARSLSAQMSQPSPLLSASPAQTPSRAVSTNTSIQTVTSSLPQASSRATGAAETTTAQKTVATGTNKSMVVSDERTADTAQQTQQEATNNKPSLGQQSIQQTTEQAEQQVQQQQKKRVEQQTEQQAKKEEQTTEEKNKNETHIHKVQSQITGVRRDITFLVGRAAINETAREELHSRKTELSELMVELFQLERVSHPFLQ